MFRCMGCFYSRLLLTRIWGMCMGSGLPALILSKMESLGLQIGVLGFGCDNLVVAQ